MKFDGNSTKQDIFLRAHTVAPEKKRKKISDPPTWVKHVLVFDTETTTDTSQSLTFGAYRFCQLNAQDQYVCREEGFFYADEIDAESLRLLQEYVSSHAAETEKDCPRQPKLYSRSDFVEKVLWKSIQARAMVVGFNLPFDLSRIAVQWSKARNGGWSLVLSLRRSQKTGEIEANPDRPRIRVTSKDSKSAFIKLMRPRIAEEWPLGRFLDLHTLAFALHSESYSLERACCAFNIPGKFKHEPTGKVSLDEIDYCRQDVRATIGLLNAVKTEFNLHPIQLLPDRAYSPASIAKAYLNAMGIIPPKDKFKIPNRILGIAMQAYYGGRAECRIRHLPVPIVHTDFTSQYPSVNALLGNSDILTAETLSFENAIDEVCELLANSSSEDAFNPDFWKKLNFFALIKPKADIFPVRAVYNNQTKNIGVNWLSCEKPIWFAGPDVVASVLLTGKIPQIEKAFRIVPRGRQKGLKSTKLRGMITTDPKNEDFFRVVIEQRKLHKSDKALSYFLKILANAGSYGLFVELTPERQSKNEEIKVFSGQEFFPQPSQVIENHGRWYFPPIGALITAGGRLLLAMLEKSVTDAGGTYLFCDTDSLCIVSSKDGGLIPCPGGEHRLLDGGDAIKAVSWEEVERIAEKFTALNPYDATAVPGSILKIEDINFDADGNQRQLYGYAISAKRYGLFQWSGDDILILDPKAHGLGYLFPPMIPIEGEGDWTFETWDYLLRGALGLQRKEPSWLDVPATMRIVLSTPHVLRRLDHCTRPYNFLLCPLIDSVSGYPAGVDPDHFTLIMKFTKDRGQWLDSECVNVCDGKVYGLALSQSDKLDKAIPQTMGYVLRLYPNHPESKSLGPDDQICSPDTCGLLKRASVTAGTFRFVGKETDRRWEQGEDLSLMSFSTIEYSSSAKMIAADASLLNGMANYSMRELIRRTGLSQHTLEGIRSGRLVRVRTLAILKNALQSVLESKL